MAPIASFGGDSDFLIVQREVIVAKDISMTIAELYPQAHVITKSTVAEALDALELVPALAVAFIDEAPDAFDGSPLANAIAVRGGRIVLMGDAAEDADPSPGWQVLVRPFETDTVRAILQA